MIDKIIEELEEELDKAKYDSAYVSEEYSLSVDAIDKAIEIVKKYENNNWIKTKDQLPPSNYNLLKRKEYLTCNTNNGYMLLTYCEGWNCMADEKGVACKENEIEDIIAWREIDEYEGE